ncbi:MAG TPA: universal stress protein [Thermoleophilaceae bacterium]|nr:universal stress protein [Thermoleophilaceae bacterium]
MYKTVVVGTDGSPRAEKAVDEAIDLARSENSKLYLVAAFSANERHWEEIQSSAKVERVNLGQIAEQVLARTAKRAEEQGVDVDYSAEEGDPAEVLIEVADRENADLIVVGNKGMTGAKRFFLGSVPNKVVHHAPCGVMIVRTD